MIGELTLGGALLLGAAGSPHCMAMCGAITAAFGLSGARRYPVAVPLCASLGRVLGYAALGAAVGALGLAAGVWLQQPAGILVLRFVAALTLILVGLQLTAWWQPLDQIARLGAPLWRRLQPLSRRLLPIDTPGKALAFGLLWGLLPCGLVYSTLVWAMGAGGALNGGLLMLCFGLGTLPALLAMGAFAATLAGFIRQPWVRRVAGALVIGFGIYEIVLAARMILQGA